MGKMSVLSSESMTREEVAVELTVEMPKWDDEVKLEHIEDGGENPVGIEMIDDVFNEPGYGSSTTATFDAEEFIFNSSSEATFFDKSLCQSKNLIRMMDDELDEEEE